MSRGQDDSDTDLDEEELYEPRMEVKPKPVKAQRAFFASLIITLIVMISWIILSQAGTGDTRKYFVIVDAGSTGSRIHVYPYMEAFPLPKLLMDEEKNLKEKPGLSSFAEESNGMAAEQQMQKLIDFAKTQIPKEEIPNTPIFLRATAGLRKLQSQSKQDNENVEFILESVRETLMTSGFAFATTSDEKKVRADVITGHDEALYGWIAANYLNGELEKRLNDQPYTTKGVLEMGGESVQLSFELTEEESRKMDQRYIKKVSLGGVEMYLWRHSWMGYGMQAMTAKVRETSEENNPCYLTGFSDRGITGQGDFGKCKELISGIVNTERNQDCAADAGDSHLVPCLLGGIQVHPKVHSSPLYLIENFYFVANDQSVTKENFGSPKYLKTIEKVGEEYCKKAYDPNNENEKDYNCLALTWVSTIIQVGLDGSSNYEVVNEVNGGDVEWTVGTAVHELTKIKRNYNTLFMVIFAVSCAISCFFYRKSQKEVAYSFVQATSI